MSALRWLPPVLASAMIAMVASVLPGQQLLIVADDGTTGLAFRAQVGRAVTFVCPSTIVANGRVWGTDSYLDESPVCTAAIHAGVLTRGTSGQVTILISDEGQSFQGTRRNGVTSVDNGPWTSSYFEISGTDVYTSQSAICVAAVHAGVITRDGGGPMMPHDLTIAAAGLARTWSNGGPRGIRIALP